MLPLAGDGPVMVRSPGYAVSSSPGFQAFPTRWISGSWSGRSLLHACQWLIVARGSPPSFTACLRLPPRTEQPELDWSEQLFVLLALLAARSLHSEAAVDRRSALASTETASWGRLGESRVSKDKITANFGTMSAYRGLPAHDMTRRWSPITRSRGIPPEYW